MSTPGVDTFPVLDPVDTESNATAPTQVDPPAPPAADSLDVTQEDCVVYDTTSGIILMSFSGPKYQNDGQTIPSGAAKLIGYKGTSDNSMVLVSGSDPVFTSIPKVTDSSSWNVTTVDEISDGSGYGTVHTDEFTIVSGTTATLGSNLPSTIDVFLRAPQSTGWPVDWYTYPTTSGSWSFGVNSGYEGDYYLIVRAAGYQDYYVHVIVTAS